MYQSDRTNLQGQIARQSAEQSGYNDDLAALAAPLASARTWRDQCQAAVDARQAELDAALAAEQDGIAQRAALDAATATLAQARADLAPLESQHADLTARVAALQAGIDACQSSLNADPSVEADPVHVPPVVTMRQARLALLGAGLLAGVDAAISAMPEPTKSAAKIEWEYSGTVERNRPFVQALTPALGMTAAQVDQLFIAAATL